MLLQNAAKLLIAGIAAFAVLVGTPSDREALAESLAPDYDIPNGHFFTQTATGSETSGAGYSVTDDDGIPFWTVYQREGALLRIGYPLTRRFVRDGLPTQVMQKAVLQWHPGTERVEFVNILDELNLYGRDAWLEERLVPPHLMTDDGHLSWPEIVRTRLSLFGSAVELRKMYESASDPLRIYGLPTSGVVDYGGMETIRLQRGALQLWKVKTEFAEAGDVVVANGGYLAVQAGLFPDSVRELEQAPASAGPRAVALTGDGVIDRINQWRAVAGLPSIFKSPELMRAAQSHAEYYVRYADHPSMAAIGVHRQDPGLPGFTGRSIYDRAKAAGYSGNWIDEDINFSVDAAENVDLFMATVYHRFSLVHPSSVAVGYGIASGDGHEITVIDIGLDPSHDPRVALPSTYPGQGQLDVPRLWHAYESPDPVPGLPRPVGSPLTVSFLLRQNVDWGPASLTRADGQPLEVVVVESGWRKSIGVTPARPLDRGTRYTATVIGSVDGVAFTKTWSFNTAE